MAESTVPVETLLASHAASKPVWQVFLYITWKMASVPEGFWLHLSRLWARLCQLSSSYLYIWYEEEERKKGALPNLAFSNIFQQL